MVRILSQLRKAPQRIRTWEDLILFLRIAGLILVLPLLLRIMKLPRLLEFLSDSGSELSGDPEREHDIVGYTSGLLSLNILMFRSTCLTKALVLYHFFNRVGLKPRIDFGVRKTANGSLEGHAWLVVGDKIYLGNSHTGAVYPTIISCETVR